MYFLLSELGLIMGLDALTFAVVFVMAAIGSRILRVTMNSILLALLFFPILAMTSTLANFVGLAMGITEPFTVPHDELSLIRYISARDFMSVMLVTFAGMLTGLAAIFGLYRVWGHAG